MLRQLTSLVLAFTGPWVWPVDHGFLVRPFDPPVTEYGAGHRGIDISGTLGQPVRAIGSGTVTFSGLVGGKSVVVVDHGPLRSTYEPVTGSRPVGSSVSAGAVIGVLQAGHCTRPCLHLGVRRGTQYIDPRRVFQRVVLKSPARG